MPNKPSLRVVFCLLSILLALTAGLLMGTRPAIAQEVSERDWWVAIANDRVEVVRNMLAAGIDANQVGPAGQPPLMLAIREGSWSVYDVLLAHSGTAYNSININRETPLMYLAVMGETERARDLIRRGAMVNRPGWTPLHYSASTGQVDTTQMLLDHGAEVDARSSDGTTPLMMAAYSGSEAVVRLLLEAGADAHLETDQHYNVVDWAGFKQHTRLGAKLQQLIERQLADPDSTAQLDETPPTADQPDEPVHGTSRYFDPDRFNEALTP